MAADAPLTAKSTVGAWLDHPIGGALIRTLLAEGGQDESVLAPARSLPLQQLVAMSGGMLPQDRVDAMVLEANGGVAPEDDGTDDAVWTETPTTGRFAGRSKRGISF